MRLNGFFSIYRGCSMIIRCGEIVMTTIRSIFRRFQQSVVRFADFIYAGDSIGSGAQLGGQRSPFV